MFKALRDRFRSASKKAEEELDPELKLDYETFRPEERDSGAVIQEKHLDNVLWEMELALLESDVAMEALEEMKNIIKKRLIGELYFLILKNVYPPRHGAAPRHPSVHTSPSSGEWPDRACLRPGWWHVKTNPRQHPLSPISHGHLDFESLRFRRS